MLFKVAFITDTKVWTTSWAVLTITAKEFPTLLTNEEISLFHLQRLTTFA